MRRREVIQSILGSVSAWPLALVGGAAFSWSSTVSAQTTNRVRRLGVLMNLSETDPEGQARIAVLRQSLSNLHWIEGRNIQIEYRWAAGDLQRLSGYASELVAWKPDVIFAGTSASALALQRKTSAVPIVFAQAFDPVEIGLVASVPKPGGNITGFALYEYTIAVHWVELLKQIAPNVTRIAVIQEPNDPSASGFLPIIKGSARAYGLEVTTYTIHDDAETKDAIEAFGRASQGGLIPLPSPFMASHRDFIISLATAHRLPNVYAYRYYPASGGLASYGVDNIETYHQAASYIDRIFKGEKPADLPVQFPTKYQLVINSRTAKAFGLEIPASVLARTDEIIE